MAFMRWLGERRPVLAVDTETGGLEWWKDRLRLVQFGDATTGWAIGWDDWGGLVKDALRKYEGDLVMHNHSFDLRYLERYGCTIKRKRVHDTRVMAHLADPVSPTGLKPLGVRLIDARLDSSQGDLKTEFARKGWTWATVPIDFGPYWSYGALDTVITARLYELLRQTADQYERVYELEMASQQVLMDMVTRGIRIDVGYCERKYEELTKYVESMADWIHKEYGCGTADRAIAARLLADGVLLTKRTPTGQWCMDKEVLESIEHPLAQDVLARKKAQKIANTYFRNFLGKRDGDLIHPDVNPLGARTGRMSVSTPALHQLPRGRVVRDAFIPREGNKMIDVDYDQVEQRLLGHFSEDEGLIQSFYDADHGGADIFTSLARDIYGDPTITKDHSLRQTTKTTIYAKAYGAGTETLSRNAGVSFDEMDQFLNLYKAARPGIAQWEKEVERRGRERLGMEGEAYIYTAWGRRLPAEEDKLYTLVNYLIQGTAGDLLKQKLVDLDNADLASYVVLPVHDELLFDAPAEDVEEIAQAIVSVMREEAMFKVPLTCEAEIGMSWGEVH